MDMPRDYRPVSGWWFFVGGALLGMIAGLIASPAVEDYVEREEREGRGEGLVSRLYNKIPTRVKAASAIGALKEGGTETYHELKEKVTGSR